MRVGPAVSGADPDAWDEEVDRIFDQYPNIDTRLDIGVAMELASARLAADPAQRATIPDLDAELARRDRQRRADPGDAEIIARYEAKFGPGSFAALRQSGGSDARR